MKDMFTIIVKLKNQPHEPPRETDCLYESVESFVEQMHRKPEDYEVLMLGRNCGKMTNILENA